MNKLNNIKKKKEIKYSKLEPLFSKILSKKSNSSIKLSPKSIFSNLSLPQEEKIDLRFIIFDGDSEKLMECSEIKILLAKIAEKNLWVLPKVSLYIPLGETDENISRSLIERGKKYFEYFYDIRFISCCENPIFKIKDCICIPLGKGEWKGIPKVPRPPVYPHFDSLMWFDPKKASYDEDYISSLNVGEESLNIIKLILIKINYTYIK